MNNVGTMAIELEKPKKFAIMTNNVVIDIARNAPADMRKNDFIINKNVSETPVQIQSIRLNTIIPINPVNIVPRKAVTA